MKLQKIMYVPCYKGKPIGQACEKYEWAWRECSYRETTDYTGATKVYLRKLGYSVEKYDLVRRAR